MAAHPAGDNLVSRFRSSLRRPAEMRANFRSSTLALNRPTGVGGACPWPDSVCYQFGASARRAPKGDRPVTASLAQSALARPIQVFDPAKGLLHAEHFQIAYVTNDV